MFDVFPALQLLPAHADSKNTVFNFGICYPESRRKGVDFGTTYESGLVSNKPLDRCGFLRVSGESVAVLKIGVGSFCPNFNRALYAELTRHLRCTRARRRFGCVANLYTE